MPFVHTFTSARATEPDLASLTTTLQGQDATAVVTHYLDSGQYLVAKSTDWTAAQITAVQNFVDSAPACSAQLFAQSTIDGWPIETKALVLALIDQLNVIRAALPIPLGAITPAQALAAIRAKAATL